MQEFYTVRDLAGLASGLLTFVSAGRASNWKQIVKLTVFFGASGDRLRPEEVGRAGEIGLKKGKKSGSPGQRL